ncbi:EF-hand domain-containing protein [Kordiimonas aquimaris]|uniref:hypothetical protein n=1 Tax=Kordiimonas aquimaris TaxID=707591 RepID=UPI0021CF1597|nr:hypothetical protein [Kordiimonas aquimaris]
MKYILAIATLGVLGTTALVAQDGPRGMFKQLDRDGNNVVTHEELLNEARQHFADFDHDGNQLIELAELPQEMPLRGPQKRRLERVKDRMEKRAERRDESHEPRMTVEEVEDRMRHSRIQFMARMDRDEDEQLTVEEFAAPLIKRFKKADIDGDGNVTLEEFEDTQKNMRRGRRDKRGKRQSY